MSAVEGASTHTPAVGGVNADEQDDGKRVFFGNLAYDAKLGEIKEFLTRGGGTIVAIDLPTRYGNKPAGFAFVVYSTEEEAQQAVERLNGQKLGEREIGVQIAKTASEAQAARTEKRNVKKEALKEKKKASKIATGPEGVNQDSGESRTATSTAQTGETAESASKKPKRKKAKKPARRLPEEGEDAPADESAPLSEINPNNNAQAAAATSTATAGVKKPRRKSKRGSAPGASGDAVPNDDAAEEARIDKELQVEESADVENQGKKAVKREPRKPREPKWVQTDVPSPTTVFVANLPFTVDDAALTELFTSLSIDVKSASIVRKPRFSQKILPRSKGFGFVEVADEKAQKLALEKLNGHKIGDRELTIKVANMREPINKAEGEGGGETEAEAHARADSGVQITA